MARQSAGYLSLTAETISQSLGQTKDLLGHVGICRFAPDVPFANEGKRYLRVLGFELARQAMAFENGKLDEPRRVAIANLIDRLKIAANPFRPARLKLRIERAI